MSLAGRPLRIVLALAAFVATLAVVPSWWSGRDAVAWYVGDRDRQLSLARTVAVQVQRSLEAEDFHTGSGLYSGEWLFGTYLMAGIGFCQIALEHPETAREFVPLIERCIVEIRSGRVSEFDTLSWRNEALETLGNGRGHAAYLGYFNLLLSLYRELRPNNTFTDLNDRITAALLVRIATSPNGLVETYPGEWYPVDNTAAFASIAIRARATNRGDDALIRALALSFREHAIDPVTGLLRQAVSADGAPVDDARGSGSALGVFFLGHGFQPLAREIFSAMKHELSANVLGFGAMREYPRGHRGRVDIDSGPVIFGLGFSATGFALGGARMCSDSTLFHRLWASARLAGAPVEFDGRVQFVTAGPLGNAILLAMLTAQPEGGP